MIQMYTEEALVRLLYNEGGLFEKLELEFALEEDSTLMDTFEQLQEGYFLLPKMLFSPSNQTISNILDYAK